AGTSPPARRGRTPPSARRPRPPPPPKEPAAAGPAAPRPARPAPFPSIVVSSSPQSFLCSGRFEARPVYKQSTTIPRAGQGRRQSLAKRKDRQLLLTVFLV